MNSKRCTETVQEQTQPQNAIRSDLPTIIRLVYARLPCSNLYSFLSVFNMCIIPLPILESTVIVLETDSSFRSKAVKEETLSLTVATPRMAVSGKNIQTRESFSPCGCRTNCGKGRRCKPLIFSSVIRAPVRSWSTQH